MVIPIPTDGEMAILRVLWSHGPSTVRQVHESLHDERKVGYTTVLKMLQIMREKGGGKCTTALAEHPCQPGAAQLFQHVMRVKLGAQSVAGQKLRTQVCTSCPGITLALPVEQVHGSEPPSPSGPPA